MASLVRSNPSVVEDFSEHSKRPWQYHFGNDEYSRGALDLGVQNGPGLA